jgi:hypothetical protein
MTKGETKGIYKKQIYHSHAFWMMPQHRETCGLIFIKEQF